MSVLMTMLNKDETCVLGYGVEVMFYEEVKKDKEDNDMKHGNYFTPVIYGGLY